MYVVALSLWGRDVKRACCVRSMVFIEGMNVKRISEGV